MHKEERSPATFTRERDTHKEELPSNLNAESSPVNNNHNNHNNNNNSSSSSSSSNNNNKRHPMQ